MTRTTLTYGESMKISEHHNEVSDMRARLWKATKKYRAGDDSDLRECIEEIFIEDDADFDALLTHEIMVSTAYHEIAKKYSRS